jgi:hypothetical protein
MFDRITILAPSSGLPSVAFLEFFPDRVIWNFSQDSVSDCVL